MPLCQKVVFLLANIKTGQKYTTREITEELAEKQLKLA